MKRIIGFIFVFALTACSGSSSEVDQQGGEKVQAEDGIRDVERSRGLGDVYKRQARREFLWSVNSAHNFPWMLFQQYLGWKAMANFSANGLPVSYTHLTLPTKA